MFPQLSISRVSWMIIFVFTFTFVVCSKNEKKEKKKKDTGGDTRISDE